MVILIHRTMEDGATVVSETSSLNLLRTSWENLKAKKQYSFHGERVKSERWDVHVDRSIRSDPSIETTYSPVQFRACTQW